MQKCEQSGPCVCVCVCAGTCACGVQTIPNVHLYIVWLSPATHEAVMIVPMKRCSSELTQLCPRVVMT